MPRPCTSHAKASQDILHCREVLELEHSLGLCSHYPTPGLVLTATFCCLEHFVTTLNSNPTACNRGGKTKFSNKSIPFVRIPGDLANYICDIVVEQAVPRIHRAKETYPRAFRTGFRARAVMGPTNHERRCDPTRRDCPVHCGK